MAFPVGWTRQCAVTCNHTKVGAGGVSAFPGLLTEANFPSEMLTLGGGFAAQADGGDIRFSSDAAGASQLACEVVLWTQNANPALAKAEIWVNCALSSGSDTAIYVWYNAGGAQTQPAAGAAFGSQAAWDSNFKAVYHLPNASSLSASDSTTNANNASSLNGSSAASGFIGGGASLNGSSNFITLPTANFVLPAASSVTFSGWAFRNALTQYGSDHALATRDGSVYAANSLSQSPAGLPRFSLRMSDFNQHTLTGSAAVTAGSWYFLVGRFDNNSKELSVWLNGSKVAATTLTGLTMQPAAASSGDALIGAEGNGTNVYNSYFGGSLDEIRFSTTARSDDWILTEYNNQNAPGSFWTVGTPVPVGGGGTTQQQLSMLGCGA